MIVIVNTGGANLRSIENSISRLKAEYSVSDDPEIIDKASKIILPGVGNVNRVMETIKQKK